MTFMSVPSCSGFVSALYTCLCRHIHGSCRYYMHVGPTCLEFV